MVVVEFQKNGSYGANEVPGKDPEQLGRWKSEMGTKGSGIAKERS